MATVDIGVSVTLEHRKAESACHAAPLNLPTPDELATGAFDEVAEGERFTCSACGARTARVLGAPVTVTASNG